MKPEEYTADLLEKSLQEKIEQFENAMEEGKSPSELNDIYQELKALQHELSTRTLQKLFFVEPAD